MFSWMLCEGVLLYILVVKVFGGGADEKVKYFYIFGWGKHGFNILDPHKFVPSCFVAQSVEQR